MWGEVNSKQLASEDVVGFIFYESDIRFCLT